MNPETKVCPRCKALFKCFNSDILQCACIGVLLTERQLQYIAARYEDCLCIDCLKAISDNDIRHISTLSPGKTDL